MDSRFWKTPDGRFGVHESPIGMSRNLGYVAENSDGTWSAWLLDGSQVDKQFGSQEEAGLFVYETSK
jgi:hypothetical protein